MADLDIEMADYWIAARRKSILPGSFWRHKKRGSVYEVINLAIRETDGHPLVIYRCLQSSRIWARDAGLFTDGRFEQIPTPDIGDA